MSTGTSEHDSPRWSLPPRKEISPENLHISSFVIVKNVTEGEPDYSILLLKAGDKHPLSFRRGKWLLPAAILAYGETPKQAARRVLRDQLADPKALKDPEFMGMQSYLGAHWDLVLLFGTSPLDGKASISPREPYVQASFFHVRKLPRAEIAGDHLEVIERILNPYPDD